MKLDRMLLPVCALGAIALVLSGGDGLGYSTSGDTLDLAQRSVRVFDNFTKAAANNNTTPDPNWPGYVGAELAIWKGCSEWGSTLHGGTGAGDPLQTVGSGGANFDISWQGNATEVGDTNSNTHSQISGQSGGVLAFTELPSTDGWRIRYYEVFDWQDGPSQEWTGIDLQGVACRQYGYALGLGLSTVQGATMSSMIAGTALRSIEADDIAGVQFLYGARSPSKPTITGVSVLSGQVTIAGTDFSPSNNEVWFTQAGAGGGGPVKVTGVTSSGASITVTIPAAAGPGDVLVRNDGTQHSNLSNAWPFDPAGPSCGATAYCTPKLGSHLCYPTIGSSGTPSYSAAGGFSITTTFMEVGVSAIDFFGTTGQAAIPFQGGLICVASPTHRLSGKNSGGAFPWTCSGTIGYTLQDVLDHPSGGPLVTVGGLVNIQTWSRDPGDGFGSSLSDALEIVVCP
jgi:hypothetical protein